MKREDTTGVSRESDAMVNRFVSEGQTNVNAFDGSINLEHCKTTSVKEKVHRNRGSKLHTLTKTGS